MGKWKIGKVEPSAGDWLLAAGCWLLFFIHEFYNVTPSGFGFTSIVVQE